MFRFFSFRSEDELDAVTLHNQALMNMDSKPTEGFEKLQFLLQQNPFPPETFGNLLLLYCKYEYYDLAADVLAENAHLTYKYLSPHLYDFLEALITQQTSPDEAYRKFDAIASKHTEQLRKYTKQVIGDRKDGICLHLNGQKSSSPYTAISAMLDSRGRAFVLILFLNGSSKSILFNSGQRMALRTLYRTYGHF